MMNVLLLPIVIHQFLPTFVMRGTQRSKVCVVSLLTVFVLTMPDAVYAAAAPKPQKETASQKVLRKVMDDIRHCDKSVRYEYDPKTKQINPPELRQIKGIKLKKLIKNEIAIFKINETYEGIYAVVIWMGQTGGAYSGPSFHSVAFRGEFQPVRQRLESLWDVRFTDRLRPGPDVIIEGHHAEIEMLVDGKRRFLSIEKMPRDVYPYIGFTDVGCTHVEN